MDTSDIVKRILNLKKMSVQLKQSTDNQSSMDLNTVKSIIKTGRNESIQQQFHEEDVEKKPVKQNNQNLNGVLSHLVNVELSERHNKSMPEGEYILNLKNENKQLQETLKKLQSQIEQLDKLQKLGQEEQWKDGLPYFTLQSQLLAFATKLNISQKDYDKIDYVSQEVFLHIDKINLKRKNKKQVRSFFLADLKEVHYIDNITILLHFKRGSENESLFIQFQKQETFELWDRGIFINYKMMDSMNDKFNIGDDQHSSHSNLKKSDMGGKSEVSVKSTEYKDLMKMYMQKKEKHAEKQQITKERILQKIQSKKSKEHQNIESSPSSPFIKFEGTVSKSQLDEEQNNNIDHEINVKKQRSQTSKFNFFSDMGKFLGQPQEIQQKQQDQQTIKKEKREKEEREKEESERLQRQRVLEQKRQQQLNQLKEEEQRKQRIRREQEQREELERKKKMQELQEQIRFQKTSQLLKKGFSLTKYSTGGINPHQKIVFLNPEGTKLCWVDKGQKLKPDAKHILISQIKDIKQGQIGPAIEKQVASDLILRKNCYASIHLSSKERKIVEFGAKTPEIMRNFCSDLESYWKKKYIKL